MARELAVEGIGWIGLLVAGVVLTSGCATPRGEEERGEGFGVVDVTVEGFDSDDGQALINLFLGGNGFPGDPKRAYRAESRPIEGGRVRIVFDAVPAGPIAVSVYHDEDSDFELDTNLIGIPTERWGVSRDAGGFLGPPSFESARLDLESEARLSITIRIG